MRDAKFRAWHKVWSPREVDIRDWHHPGQKINGMQFVTGIWISNKGLKWVDLIPNDDSFKESQATNRVSLEDFKSSVRLDEVELMQYTGLKDIKGIEIYEGDIIEHVMARNISVSKIMWFRGSFCILCNGDKIPLKDYASNSEQMNEFEVIGNIYENPELVTR